MTSAPEQGHDPAWLQLRALVPRERTTALEAALHAHGALAITLREAGEQPVLEPGVGETPLWARVNMLALFGADCEIAPILGQLASDFPDIDWSVQPLADEPWSRRWLEHFQPVCCGERLWICPRGQEPPQPDATNLILDPGLAFGTGTHPTTHLCLGWLDEHDVTEQVVVDFGCGSGILAIAALLLGARHVIAVDHDPQALRATSENAALNSVAASRLTLCQPADARRLFQLLDDEGLTIDTVLANILAGPLIELAPVLSKPLHHKGALILSGLLEKQCEKVVSAYSNTVAFAPPVVQEGWARLDGQKNIMRC